MRDALLVVGIAADAQDYARPVLPLSLSLLAYRSEKAGV